VGHAQVLDPVTGKARTTFNVERSAGKCTVERESGGLRFEAWRPRPPEISDGGSQTGKSQRQGGGAAYRSGRVPANAGRNSLPVDRPTPTVRAQALRHCRHSGSDTDLFAPPSPSAALPSGESFPSLRSRDIRAEPANVDLDLHPRSAPDPTSTTASEVLTSDFASSIDYPLHEQVLTLLRDAVEPSGPTPLALEDSPFEAIEPPSLGHRGKRGGWRSSTGLTWTEVKEIHRLDFVARSARYPLNYLVSVMPETGDDQERKRSCSRLIAHLGQHLRRHGSPHVGVTVYKKASSADLHAHHLVHIPPRKTAVLEWIRSRPEMHVRRAVESDPGYVTKERLPLPPDCEARVCHNRRRGLRIPGKRYSGTGDLLELANPAAERAKR
jgi:hypothetical protein